MGFSVSAATVIIGVAIVMALEVSLGSLIPIYTDIQDSYHDMKKRSIDELQTDIDIEGITVTANATLHDINISLKNSGSTALKNQYFTILIDGIPKSFIVSSTYIYPEQTENYFINGISGSGEKKIKIIASNGISTYSSYVTP